MGPEHRLPRHRLGPASLHPHIALQDRLSPLRLDDTGKLSNMRGAPGSVSRSACRSDGPLVVGLVGRPPLDRSVASPRGSLLAGRSVVPAASSLGGRAAARSVGRFGGSGGLACTALPRLGRTPSSIRPQPRSVASSLVGRSLGLLVGRLVRSSGRSPPRSVGRWGGVGFARSGSCAPGARGHCSSAVPPPAPCIANRVRGSLLLPRPRARGRAQSPSSTSAPAPPVRCWTRPSTRRPSSTP